MRWRFALAAVGVAVALAGPPAAAGTTADFESWRADLESEAAERGISAQTIEAALGDLTPIPRVLELDRAQPEFTLSFEQYLARVAPESRISRGRAMLARHRALLDEIAAAYGVQARFIVALWGIETDFGRVTGGFPVIAALATLAYDGRRSEFFRKQLFDALTILDQDHVSLDAMTGSWAGAMGQNQFMPSSFLGYAVDHDGDGRRDIWGSEADVLASIANYLSSFGWRDDETWGREVRLPSGFDSALSGLETAKPLSEWQRLGIRRIDGRDLPSRNLPGSIVFAEGEGGRAFLVYDNFRTILKWNRSTFFALAVGYLADRIGGG